MKKNYITPKINVVQLEALCNGNFLTTSVFKGSTEGESIGKFDVLNENETKDKDWWESDNWGDD